jgi:hypothetical protein
MAFDVADRKTLLERLSSEVMTSPGGKRPRPGWGLDGQGLSRRKTLPDGTYWGTLQALRAMCEPLKRVPLYGAWLWRLRNSGGAQTSPVLPGEDVDGSSH